MSVENEHQRKSRKIASNTVALFVRMFVVTLVNLYAVRLVWKGLGDMDYGIFNTIAGVVTISACISSTLSVALQRFYSIALGHHDSVEFQKIFSTSVDVVVGVSILVALLFETVGLWFANTQLVIPAERLVAANWIYQFALVMLLFSFLQIPFTAAIFAHEAMGVYALISTVDCLLRIGVAYLMSKTSADHLVFYSAGLLMVGLLVFLSYVCIARRRYRECRYRRAGDRNMYRQLLSFSGWTLFGSVSNIGLIQGSIILLNIFFGPLIVASFAIAQQINAAFTALSGSMVLSFRPAMIKAYSEGDEAFLSNLFTACNKFVVYVLAAVAIPIFSEMDTILSLWLVDDVSATTVLFSRLIIIYIVCAALHNPITIIMQASGHLREYHLPVESVCLMSVPLTWLLFRLGCPSYAVFISIISLCALAHAVRVMCIRRHHAAFSLRRYLGSIMAPALLIVMLCSAFTCLLHSAVDASVLRLILVMLVVPCTMLAIVYLVGLSHAERVLIRNLIPLKKGGNL